MNIVVGSLWRDSSRNVPRYVGQVDALKRHVGTGHHVRVIAAEGDSTDGTAQMLLRQLWDLQLVDVSNGEPRYGSTEQPERMAALSKIGNSIFFSVRPDDDVLVYVESDLIWDPHTIGSLIDAAMEQKDDFDVFAPLVFAGKDFYDVWGFRGMDGQRFAPFAPYHSSLRPTGFTEVSSVGSCLVMRRRVAVTVHPMVSNALVEWCGNARAQRFHIAVWADFKVRHP